MASTAASRSDHGGDYDGDDATTTTAATTPTTPAMICARLGGLQAGSQDAWVVKRARRGGALFFSERGPPLLTTRGPLDVSIRSHKNIGGPPRPFSSDFRSAAPRQPKELHLRRMKVPLLGRGRSILCCLTPAFQRALRLLPGNHPERKTSGAGAVRGRSPRRTTRQRMWRCCAEGVSGQGGAACRAAYTVATSPLRLARRRFRRVAMPPNFGGNRPQRAEDEGHHP